MQDGYSMSERPEIAAALQRTFDAVLTLPSPLDRLEVTLQALALIVCLSSSKEDRKVARDVATTRLARQIDAYTRDPNSERLLSIIATTGKLRRWAT